MKSKLCDMFNKYPLSFAYLLGIATLDVVISAYLVLS